MRTTGTLVKGQHGELLLENVDHEIEVESDLARYPSP
jgi:hypothetical protein